MKTLKQVGVLRIARFLFFSLAQALLDLCWVPPFRAVILRGLGAKVGRDSVIMKVRFINADRGGFRNLSLGRSCFMGDDVLLDLAGPIVLEDHVTIAARTTILTHLTVGFADHPLMGSFPPQCEGVRVGEGSFVGACCILLPGSLVERGGFLAAGSLLRDRVSEGTIAAGSPARTLRRIDEQDKVEIGGRR